MSDMKRINRQPLRSRQPRNYSGPPLNYEGAFSRAELPTQELVLTVIKARQLEDSPELRDRLADMATERGM